MCLHNWLPAWPLLPSAIDAGGSYQASKSKLWRSFSATSRCTASGTLLKTWPLCPWRELAHWIQWLRFTASIRSLCWCLWCKVGFRRIPWYFWGLIILNQVDQRWLGPEWRICKVTTTFKPFVSIFQHKWRWIGLVGIRERYQPGRALAVCAVKLLPPYCGITC